MTAVESQLFAGLPDEQTVWMSHRDTVTAPPAGAEVVAVSTSTPVAAFEQRERGLYGVQFHPGGRTHAARPGSPEELPLHRRRGAARVDARRP
jgi:GMP synthase-like glutamine amidotransferase